ncbi:hypothetical protein HMPREF9622_00357 [Cutibacterium modestum HL037PA3]|uniref:Uncharacterized protein n=1 Tax=Cutibacterium modestum HL044PA1 TaxID=765109 RepID=A0ABN0C211_9ACTN|nr:hypothetical protein HMPREF9621_00337 [Cutibacterium modestum HL037PA2]EFS91171.1 hypothetical protein HMPREF9607_02461 [Cutibacterium modestum HL044PA1]EFT16527.1 hypothetical protein HMPREF9622_00357 [Cutibacterium modestum HL037PA3]
MGQSLCRQLLNDARENTKTLDVNVAFTSALEEHLVAYADTQQRSSFVNPFMDETVPTHDAQPRHTRR